DYISPDRDELKFRALADRFPELLPKGRLVGPMDEGSGRGILIVYGDMPTEKAPKAQYAFVPQRKILDENFDPHGKTRARVFKGEPEIYKELSFLVHGQEKRKIYFLQGDGEIDITLPDARRRGNLDLRPDMSMLGASMLVDRLKKDNYEVQ